MNPCPSPDGVEHQSPANYVLSSAGSLNTEMCTPVTHGCTTRSDTDEDISSPPTGQTTAITARSVR